MSKKNKKLKQLLNAQMSAGIKGSADQKAPEQAGTQMKAESTPQAVNNKDVAEIALIKKDVVFSLIIIITVIVLLIAIYVIDRTNPFLLDLANKIFGLIQR